MLLKLKNLKKSTPWLTPFLLHNEFMKCFSIQAKKKKACSQKEKHMRSHPHTLDSNQCEPFILCFSKAFSAGTNYNPPQLYGPAEREREKDFLSGRLHAHSPQSGADH